MKFSMSESELPGKRYNRERLLPGRHVCRVVDARYNEGFKGNFFILDFVVLSGPTPAGREASWLMDPSQAKGGVGVPAARARKLDIGRIKICIAACYGNTAEEADALVDDQVYTASIARPISPLAGRVIVVKAIAGKSGGVFYEFEPCHPEEAAEALAAPTPMQPVQAPSAAPATPPAPTTPAFPPPGWAVHPDNQAYVFNAATKQVVSVEDLKAGRV